MGFVCYERCAIFMDAGLAIDFSARRFIGLQTIIH